MATVIKTIGQNPLCTGCGLCVALCLSVCPFADHVENEDTIGKKLYGKVQGIDHHL